MIDMVEPAKSESPVENAGPNPIILLGFHPRRCRLFATIHSISIETRWWLTYPSEKYESNGIIVPNLMEK